MALSSEGIENVEIVEVSNVAVLATSLEQNAVDLTVTCQGRSVKKKLHMYFSAVFLPIILDQNLPLKLVKTLKRKLNIIYLIYYTLITRKLLINVLIFLLFSFSVFMNPFLQCYAEFQVISYF